ncbi:MAG TPA: cytotoxic necrotizing factor Rho-activating domain-containing protein [Paraburkholderia sp.]|nr:cytotoxic necrotizing factor Rho-activating domain-containing protein [Paraburkholderia sp.]
MSGVQYVSVQGGSWLSLNPAVIAGQVTTRFGEFGGNVLGIQDKLRAGGTLTTDDVTALRRYSVVMHALMPLDPLLRKQVELQGSNNGGPQIRYLGSVKIRTDYTPAEVIEMTSQALRKPFTSFVKSAQDISNKLNRGEPLSPEEEATIERYAGIADQFRLLTPGGQVMNGVGTLLAGSYSAWEGKPLNREMAREMLDLLNTRVDMRKASAPVSSSSAVPLPKGAPNAPGLNNAPGFKPPTRLPGGRVGYPLGPTKPPRLPATRGTGPQPGPSGVGARASSLARLGRAQVGELKGKGPLNLRASDSGTPPDQPLGKVGVPFNYYRSDRDVQMSTSQPAEAVPFSQRRDVLTVGTAKEATSYDAKARTYFGNRWDKKSGGLASDTQVIKIDNGREGVGAIFVPFTNIPPGGRLVVTGGALSGCTVMMAANKQGFYAWHAGTDRPGTQWTTANNGAASIVNAHNAMGGGQHVVPTAGGQSSDLLSVAGQYPFSVIVYNGKAQMLPAGATGPAGNKMTSFSYYEPDPRKMALGTAEAVIARDRSGNVVVRVWAEKGALTDPRSVKDGTQTRYTMESGQMSTYEVPASS